MPALSASIFWPRKKLLIWFSVVLSITLGFLGTLGAAPGQRTISSTFLLKPVVAEVQRGGDADLLIEVIPAYGQEISFKISVPPKFGNLVAGDKPLPSSQYFHYKNIPLPKSSSDSFQFRVKAPGHAWSTYTGEIHIKDPPGTVAMKPEFMDFGTVPIGATAQQTLFLSNNFGSPVSGTLVVTAPWKIVEDPSFQLDEGKSCNYTINFSPTDLVPTTGIVKTAPEIANFPVLPLKGVGIAPFALDHVSTTLGSDDPFAPFQVTNVSPVPIHLAWSGDPDLDFSPPQTIAPGESAKLWISAVRLQLPIEGRKELTPLLMEDHFSQSVKLEILGPKGSVSIEALGADEMFAAKIGHPITLEGILHNTSQSTRVVDLSLLNFPGDKPSVLKTITLNPSQTLPVSISWTPKTAGLCTPTLLVSESGKSLCCASWKTVVAGSNVSPAIHRVISSQSEEFAPAAVVSIPENTFRRASEREKQATLVPLPPSFGDGLWRRSLVFHWRYLGAENTQFSLRKHEISNALMNRTGENADRWNLVFPDSPARKVGNDTWECSIPMPFPGKHEYLITPDLPGDKITAPIQIGITWGMFIWPAFRLVLIVCFLLIVFRAVRNRI